MCKRIDLEADSTFRHLALGMSPKTKLADYKALALRLHELNAGLEPVLDIELSEEKQHLSGADLIVARAEVLGGGPEVPRRLALALLLIVSATSSAEVASYQDHLKIVPDGPNAPYNDVERRCARLMHTIWLQVLLHELKAKHLETWKWLKVSKIPLELLPKLTGRAAEGETGSEKLKDHWYNVRLIFGSDKV